MGLGFGPEDIQQLGIRLIGDLARGLGSILGLGKLHLDQGQLRQLGSGGQRTTALGQRLVEGQGMGRLGQPVHVVTLALTLLGVLRHQLRQQRTDIVHHPLHGGTMGDTVVQPAIEQILQRPGQLADDQRLHHAATALERMEVAPQFGEGGPGLGIGVPDGQPVFQLRLDVTGLFDEDLAQFLLHRLGIGGGRQQRKRHLRRRRIDGIDRGGQHLGDRARRRTRRCQGLQLEPGQQLFGLFAIRVVADRRLVVEHRRLARKVEHQ